MLGRRDLEPESTPAMVAQAASGIIVQSDGEYASALRRGAPNTVAQSIVRTQEVSNRTIATIGSHCDHGHRGGIDSICWNDLRQARFAGRIRLMWRRRLRVVPRVFDSGLRLRARRLKIEIWCQSCGRSATTRIGTPQKGRRMKDWLLISQLTRAIVRSTLKLTPLAWLLAVATAHANDIAVTDAWSLPNAEIGSDAVLGIGRHE